MGDLAVETCMPAGCVFLACGPWRSVESKAEGQGSLLCPGSPPPVTLSVSTCQVFPHRCLSFPICLLHVEEGPAWRPCGHGPLERYLWDQRPLALGSRVKQLSISVVSKATPSCLPSSLPRVGSRTHL